MDKTIDTDGKYAAKVVTDFGFIPKREDLIQRGALLDAYDAAHKDPPGGARKLIATTPAVDAIPVEWMEAQDNIAVKATLAIWQKKQEART